MLHYTWVSVELNHQCGIVLVESQLDSNLIYPSAGLRVECMKKNCLSRLYCILVIQLTNNTVVMNISYLRIFFQVSYS